MADSNSNWNSYLVTAAIDFGTTLSGYSFGFNGTKAININRNWGSELGHQSYKTPTCVLIGPDGEFVSFGYEAEQDFISGEKGSDHGYNLFQHFKMKLHDEKIHLNTYIKSTTGKQRPAIDIFVMAVKYLKDHMLKLIRNAHVSALEDSMIKWVITVPAIWKEESKYFMREVAYSAGIITEVDSDQLVIALEPEAASLYCRNLPVDRFNSNGQDTTDLSFERGEKYLVVDAGGGTVNITAHEVMYMGRVKEIHPPTGGPWGGIYVDKNYIKFLNDIFGSDFISKYKATSPKDWLNMMCMFEKTKRLKKTNQNNNLTIQLSYSFGMSFRKFRDIDIDKYIAGKSIEGVKFRDGALLISSQLVDSFYRDILNRIVDHIKNLLENLKLSFNYVIFVGGFGECKALQKAVINVFASNVTVIVPHEAQLAIMKGAVIFGQKPEMVVSRIARLTYGVGVSLPFDANIHNVEKRFKDQGEWYCNDIFEVIIAKGDEVKGSISWKTYLGLNKRAYRRGKSHIPIYYSQNEDVVYTTDTGVEKIGKLTVYHNKETSIDQTGIDIWFHIGGTELIVQAKNTTGGKKVKTVFDFSCSLE